VLEDSAPKVAAADLIPPLARMLGEPILAISEWSVAPLGYRHVNPLTGGLFRVRGTALCRDGERTWSIVLKTCRRPPDALVALVPPHARERVGAAHRWDREALAYESGLLADLGGRFVAPRCYAVRRSDEDAWLWLEDVSEDRSAWTADRYHVAARHLGQFNGGYVAGRDLPTNEWLSSRWLQSWFGSIEAENPQVLEDDAVWDHPLVRAAFPAGSREELRRARMEHVARETLLDVLPQTLCHLDAFRANLLSRLAAVGGPETVAVDWSFVGIAPLGADASQLVTASVLDRGERLELAVIDAGVWEGYLVGLADQGWRGDERVVRAGYLAADLVRWLFTGLRALMGAVDESARVLVEQEWRMSTEEIIHMLGQRTTHLLARARELRALLADLDLPSSALAHAQ
jgi:hypothetical protein